MSNKHIAPVVIKTPRLSPLSLAIRAAIIGVGLAHGAANATTIIVTSNADNNGDGCTLREAIASANTTTNQGNGCSLGSNTGTDTIFFFNSLFASNTITLTQGELVVGAGKDIEIDASNVSGGLTIDANRQSRVLSVRDAATLTLDNLNLTGGSVSDSVGGGVSVIDSNVSLNNCTVSDNSARTGAGINATISRLADRASVSLNNCIIYGNSVSRDGGGIAAYNYNYDDNYNGPNNSAVVISVVNSTISGNLASEGAGIFSESSTVNVSDSIVSANNSSGGRGGGITVLSSNLELTNSTVSGNTTEGILASGLVRGSGGGIFAGNSSSGVNSSVIVNNSTVSGNLAGRDGGGINADCGTRVNIYNSTMSANSAGLDGGGILADFGSYVSLNNSIIANSLGGGDCREDRTSVTFDSATIVEDNTCNANRFGDPSLFGLADNGGPTQTHALASNSIARNSSIGTCPATDQRGETRDISDGFCDVGAVEFDPSLANPATTTFVIPLPNGKSVIFDL